MKVYEAIRSVMRDLGLEGISKNKKNQMQGYSFRGIDDVLLALNPLLSKHGLVICPRVISRETVERQTKNGGAMFYTFLNVEFDLVCVEDGSKQTVSTFGEAQDSSDKSCNKAISAAYKVMAFNTFCIPTEAAIDTEAESPEAVSASVAAKTEAKTKQIAQAIPKAVAEAMEDPEAFMKTTSTGEPQMSQQVKELITGIKTRIGFAKTEDELRFAWADFNNLLESKKIPLNQWPVAYGNKFTKDMEALKNLRKEELRAIK